MHQGFYYLMSAPCPVYGYGDERRMNKTLSHIRCRDLNRDRFL